jgi:hypothetical protein
LQGFYNCGGKEENIYCGMKRKQKKQAYKEQAEREAEDKVAEERIIYPYRRNKNSW